jgi:hypothetical protein
VVTNFKLFFSCKVEVAGGCSTLERKLFFYLCIHFCCISLEKNQNLVKIRFIRGEKPTRKIFNQENVASGSVPFADLFNLLAG